MLLKKQLLSAKNINSLFISKTDTTAQTLTSSLTVGGGQLTLKSSTLTDNASNSYLRIDPQGNEVIVYDGVSNQKLSVYSSSGSESIYLTGMNGTKSYGLLDVSGAMDHIEIATASGKTTKFGGNLDLTGASSRRIFMGGVSAGDFGLAYDSANPNYGIFYKEGTTDKITLSPDGGGPDGTAFVVSGTNVGIGNNAPAYKLDVTGDIRVSGTMYGTLSSSVATGTAPLTVVSTTKVANFNSDLLDGLHADATATANTIIARDANGRAKVASPSAGDDIARKDYVDQQITAVSATGIPKLQMSTYSATASTANQTQFSIPMDTFDSSTDTIIVYQNTTYLDGSTYLITNHVKNGSGVITTRGYITLITGVASGTEMFMQIWKNVPVGVDGSINGRCLAVNTIPIDRIIAGTFTGTFGFSGPIQKVNNVTTAGNFGVSSVVASASEMVVNTVSTTIASFTPMANGNFELKMYIRSTGSTTLTLTATWTDAGGARTFNWVSNEAVSADGFLNPVLFINAVTTGPITISATAGAASTVYASATIEAK